ncbi:hypothetical protein BD309DRAFT_1064631 [Dichomitus squalens]|nr:hypothetical protein BD309DRAFT_1064631 [Dichomitus squalens]
MTEACELSHPMIDLGVAVYLHAVQIRYITIFIIEVRYYDSARKYGKGSFSAPELYGLEVSEVWHMVAYFARASLCIICNIFYELDLAHKMHRRFLYDQLEPNAPMTGDLVDLDEGPKILP